MSSILPYFTGDCYGKIKDMTKDLLHGAILVEKSTWNEKNILADLEKFFQEGGEIAEIDARLTSDNVFVIAHWDKIQGGKYIHDLTKAEVDKIVSVPTLEEVFEMIQSYASRPGRRIVLEVKTLGAEENVDKNIKQLEKLIMKYKMGKFLIFSSLSPSILTKIADEKMKIPMILNSAIVPYLSYPRNWFFKGLRRFLSRRKHEFLRIGTRRSAVVLGTRDGIMNYPRVRGGDSWNEEIIYVATEVPDEVLEALNETRGCAISVAPVVVVSNLLIVVGLKRAGEKLLQRYVEKVRGLGLNIQLTTWGAINSPSRFKAWQPLRQIERFERAGVEKNDIIYTKEVLKLKKELGK
jgi:hypothetical protein